MQSRHIAKHFQGQQGTCYGACRLDMSQVRTCHTQIARAANTGAGKENMRTDYTSVEKDDAGAQLASGVSARDLHLMFLGPASHVSPQ